MTTAHTLRTLARFLIGNKQAIEHIAASKAALWASFLFVLSAGLAREYDGEYLLAEPWHALRPLAASTVTGTVLFLILHTCIALHRAHSDRSSRSLLSNYRRFITCFWMTAPLAWLYAIPYERFMSPVEAVHINLWTLTLVAAWRVLLITRVASVLFGIRFAPTFFIVMLFSNVVAFAAFTLIPTPIIDVMGGIQHTERDALIASVASSVRVLTFISAPVWLIAAVIAMSKLDPYEPTHQPQTIPAKAWAPVCVCALLMWTYPLIIAQPEQARRHAVMQHFDANNIPAALAELSNHERRDFPLRWEPPPRLGYRERTPDLDQVQTIIDSQPTASWVAAEYAAKVARPVRRRIQPFTNSWTEVLTRIEERYPESFGLSYGWQKLEQTDLDEMRFVLRHAELPEEERTALQTLTDRLERALAEPPTNPDP